MPRWVKRVFLKVLPKLLLMRQPSYQIKIGNYSYTYANIMEEASKYDELFSHRPQQQQSMRKTAANHTMQSSMIYTTSGGESGYKYKQYSASSLPSQSPEVAKAIEGINYVCEHLKKEDLEKVVREQWKYVALVIDRLFLWIFTTACIVGTCAIILQAPSFYDTLPPIDKKISRRFTDVNSLF